MDIILMLTALKLCFVRGFLIILIIVIIITNMLPKYRCIYTLNFENVPQTPGGLLPLVY